MDDKYPPLPPPKEETLGSSPTTPAPVAPVAPPLSGQAPPYAGAAENMERNKAESPTHDGGGRDGKGLVSEGGGGRTPGGGAGSPPDGGAAPANKEVSIKGGLPVLYVMWLLGGFFGLHRFYLGRWFTGLLYLFSWGLFGFGWLFDAFWLPKMFRQRLQELATRQKEDKEAGTEEKELELAPWAEGLKHGWYARLSTVGHLAFFLIAPALVYLVSFLFQQWLMALIIPVILALTGLVRNARNHLLRHGETLAKIPILKDILKQFQSFYDYYYEYKPRTLWFYMLYPLLGPIFLVFSSRSRKELKLYMSFFGVISIALVGQIVFSFKDLYLPHLTAWDAFGVIMVELLFVFVCILAFLMPMMATTFRLSFSGRQTELRVLTIGSFCVLLLTAAVMSTYQEGDAPMKSAILVRQKLKKPKFQKEILVVGQVFLPYYSRRPLPVPPKKKKAKKKKRKKFLRYVHDGLTELMRKHLQGFLPESQAGAFFTVVLPGRRPGTHWLGMLIRSNRPVIVLCLADPTGRFYTSIKQVPAWMQQRVFQVLQSQTTNSKSKSKRYYALYQEFRAKRYIDLFKALLPTLNKRYGFPTRSGLRRRRRRTLRRSTRGRRYRRYRR